MDSSANHLLEAHPWSISESMNPVILTSDFSWRGSHAPRGCGASARSWRTPARCWCAGSDGERRESRGRPGHRLFCQSASVSIDHYFRTRKVEKHDRRNTQFDNSIAALAMPQRPEKSSPCATRNLQPSLQRPPRTVLRKTPQEHRNPSMQLVQPLLPDMKHPPFAHDGRKSAHLSNTDMKNGVNASRQTAPTDANAPTTENSLRTSWSLPSLP